MKPRALKSRHQSWPDTRKISDGLVKMAPYNKTRGATVMVGMQRVMSPSDGNDASDKPMPDAVEAIEAARPPSGLRPETEQE